MMTADPFFVDAVFDAEADRDRADPDRADPDRADPVTDSDDDDDDRETAARTTGTPPSSILKSHFKYSPRYSLSGPTIPATATSTTSTLQYDDDDGSILCIGAPRRNSMDTSADVIRRHNARHRRRANRRNSLDGTLGLPAASAAVFHDSFSSADDDHDDDDDRHDHRHRHPHHHRDRHPAVPIVQRVHFADGLRRDRSITPPSVVTSIRCRPVTPSSEIDRLFYSSEDIRRFKREYREVVKRALARRAERLLVHAEKEKEKEKTGGIDNSAWRSKSGGRWHGSLTSAAGSSVSTTSSTSGNVIVDFGKRHRDKQDEYEQEHDHDEDDSDRFVDAEEETERERHPRQDQNRIHRDDYDYCCSEDDEEEDQEVEEDQDDGNGCGNKRATVSVTAAAKTTTPAASTMGGIFSSVFDVARDVVSSLSSVPLSSECYSSTSSFSSFSYPRTTSTPPASTSGRFHSSSSIGGDVPGGLIHSYDGSRAASSSSSAANAHAGAAPAHRGILRNASSPTYYHSRHRFHDVSESRGSSLPSGSRSRGSGNTSGSGSGYGFRYGYGHGGNGNGGRATANSTTSTAHLVDTLYLF